MLCKGEGEIGLANGALETSNRSLDWLHYHAYTRKDAVAIEHVDGRLTYNELLCDALRTAQSLREKGVRPGYRVGVAAKHGLSFARALHGIMQAGAIIVPVNVRLTPTEIAWQLENAGVCIVITDDEHVTLMSESMARVESNHSGVSVAAWNIQAEQTHGLVEDAPSSTVPDNMSSSSFRSSFDEENWRDLEQIQAIVYTSGTTGFPKGVQISYANHLAQALASAVQLGLDTKERWLVPMPLFHVGGMGVLMRSLVYGSTAVLHDRFDAERVNQALAHDSITLISVVPTMLKRMLDDKYRTSYQPTLRCVLLGGSAASEGLLRACQDAGIPVAQSYGMTETNTQVATIRPEDGLRKLGSSGKPLFQTSIQVVTNGQLAAPFESGEICVRGPSVTNGYWENKAATTEAFVDGWLRTGDVGYLDDDGYLYVLDRRRDLIVSGGENVYPAEIERVIQTLEGVEEVGVVGDPDDEWGQVPVAFIVVRSGQALTEQDVFAHCGEHLARYKIPKRVYWRDELPRNASGKLLRRRLVEWLDIRS